MYLIKQLFNINFKKIKDVINEVHNKTNKPHLFIFFDLLYCILVYKAGYTDYLYFNMYKLNKKERKNILTRGKNNYYIKKLNPKKYWKYISNKALFNEKFKSYLNRDYMVLKENNFNDFKTFIKNKKEIIVKPINQTCGIGVEKIKVGEYEPKKLYHKLLNQNQILIEEVAEQHKKISSLHPDSINTVRIVTIKNKYNVTTIVAAIQRIGTNHNIVDNFHHEGICAPIDIKKGIINNRGVNKKGEYFTTHPTTNIKIEGFKIPHWNKVIKLVKQASNEIPELNIIGWDICIGKEKPFLIEANEYPAYDLYKMINKNEGMIPTFEKALIKTK